MSPHDDANRALIEILRAELPAAPKPAPRPASVPQDAPPTPAR
ncbi:hypothetical protein [Deinococcus actinosclerus]|nr:hypothetical protein [Deinococcus actinosclerus]